MCFLSKNLHLRSTASLVLITGLVVFLPFSGWTSEAEKASDLGSEFLLTRVTVTPLLQVFADSSFSDLGDLAGVELNVAVRRPRWRGTLESLWLGWTYAVGSAKTPDSIEQKMKAQTYRGGIALQLNDRPWIPQILLGAGIVTIELEEGSRSDRGYVWQASGEALWRWQVDQTWHLESGLGALTGPKVEIFDKTYQSTSFIFRIGVGYVY